MPNYDSTARVPFKHGGSVKKPEVKRIILWKGKAKDWPGAKKAAEQLRNKKAEGGWITKKEKLDQNEDLAHLRADTSLTKTQMTIDAREESDRFKQRDVRILKGPQR